MLRSRDRRFALSLAGMVVVSMSTILVLAPQKVRAQVAGALARMGARRFSAILAGPLETSRTHSGASAGHGNGSDAGAGSSFEVPAIWPAEAWSPGAALARSLFNGSDTSERDSFLLRAGLPGNVIEGWPTAPGEWAGQQGSRSVAGSNTAGRQGPASAVSGVGSGAGSAAGSGTGNPSRPGSAAMKPVGLTSSHGSDSRGGLHLLAIKPGSHSLQGSETAGGTLVDSKNDALKVPPSVVKALVTGSDNSFSDDTGSRDSAGLMDDILDIPSLQSGSGSGNAGVPGQGRASVPAPAGSNGTPNGNPVRSDPPVGDRAGGKVNPVNSPGGDSPGQTQDRQAGATPVSSLSETSDLAAFEKLDDTILVAGPQAVPEPNSLQLLIAALLGIVVLKLGSTRKA